MQEVPAAPKAIDGPRYIVLSTRLFLGEVVLHLLPAPEHVCPLPHRKLALDACIAPRAIAVAEERGKSLREIRGIPPRLRLASHRHAKLRLLPGLGVLFACVLPCVPFLVLRFLLRLRIPLSLRSFLLFVQLALLQTPNPVQECCRLVFPAPLVAVAVEVVANLQELLPPQLVESAVAALREHGLDLVRHDPSRLLLHLVQKRLQGRQA